MTNNRGIKKVLLTLVGLVLILLVITVVHYSLKYRDLVRANYKTWVAQASDSLYLMDVGQIDINVFTRRITISDIFLRPDTARINQMRAHGLAIPGVLTMVQIPKVVVGGIKWEDLLVNKIIKVGRVSVEHPTIHLQFVTKDSAEKELKPPPIDSAEKLRRQLATLKFFKNNIHALGAGKLEITEPKFYYETYPKKSDNPYFISMGGHIVLNDWFYTPSQPKDTTLLFYAQNGNVVISEVTYYQPHNDYAYYLDSLQFDPATFSCKLKGFRMFTLASEAQWHQRHPIQTSRYHLVIPRIDLKKLNWRNFIYNDYLMSDTLELDNAVLRVTIDRNYLPDTVDKRVNFPSLAIARSKLPFYLKNLIVKNGGVYYKEISTLTDRPAVVAFSNINMDMHYVTNMYKKFSDDSVIKVNGTATFMNGSPVTAQLNLYNKPNTTKFDVSLRLKDADEYDINAITNNMVLLETKKLHINDVMLQGGGNADSISLSGYLKYKHLEVNIKKMDTSSKTISIRPFISMLANQFALMPNNPDDNGHLKTVSVQVQNVWHRSIITLVWKGILNAAIYTAINDDDIIAALKNKEAMKKDKIMRKEERQELRRERKAHKAERKSR